jgi:hypothetical protein
MLLNVPIKNLDCLESLGQPMNQSNYSAYWMKTDVSKELSLFQNMWILHYLRVKSILWECKTEIHLCEKISNWI